MVDTPIRAVQSGRIRRPDLPPHMLVGPTGPVGYVMHRIDTPTPWRFHTVSNPQTGPSRRCPTHPTDPTRHLAAPGQRRRQPLPGPSRWSTESTPSSATSKNATSWSTTTRVTPRRLGDSMQFTDTAGRQFLCGVGRAGVHRPELAGLNLATAARDKPSDLFARRAHSSPTDGRQPPLPAREPGPAPANNPTR